MTTKGTHTPKGPASIYGPGVTVTTRTADHLRDRVPVFDALEAKVVKANQGYHGKIIADVIKRKR